ncbi:ribbon-helix-helix protein, CopG family [Conexibacter sp. JD483]|uniref:ribbon-helix-helix protein, CopG family n=1 Tax=unclassified Conexibacter TaxID=2627773 RepID=UPI0027191E70|nr:MULTISPECIES: ribbon-helix-helix protein, CopG family [unclassified Conexibacter]MDO8188313.1 ribbon-helix-helix protein, CopG family [Conexibacter sp. CPCC 205706]MDO8200739.1 ribbon-helix-helix protein, CopG family [Conexibacter sp. CPCC 205762]MDR9369463.1 ribbon-helix-helix protein, CopG family [Conexibacter sp. JD483]
MKAMTLRLDDADAATLALLARVGGQSRAAVLRQALRRHAEARRAESDFTERAQQLHAAEADALGLTTSFQEPTS